MPVRRHTAAETPSVGRLGEVSAGVGREPPTYPSCLPVQGSHSSQCPKPGQCRLIPFPLRCRWLEPRHPDFPPTLPQSSPPCSHLLLLEDRVSPALWPLASSVTQGTGHLSSQTSPLVVCDGPISPGKADALLELDWEFGRA